MKSDALYDAPHVTASGGDLDEVEHGCVVSPVIRLTGTELGELVGGPVRARPAVGPPGGRRRAAALGAPDGQRPPARAHARLPGVVAGLLPHVPAEAAVGRQLEAGRTLAPEAARHVGAPAAAAEVAGSALILICQQRCQAAR